MAKQQLNLDSLLKEMKHLVKEDIKDDGRRRKKEYDIKQYDEVWQEIVDLHKYFLKDDDDTLLDDYCCTRKDEKQRYVWLLGEAAVLIYRRGFDFQEIIGSGLNYWIKGMKAEKEEEE